MKDFISKATFGFIMAQLFPGAVAVLSVTFLYLTVSSVQPVSFLLAVRSIVLGWHGLSLAAQLFVAGFSVGAGMVIHGIHWSTIGFYETTTKNAVFDTFLHDKRLVYQVLVGPFKIVGETAELFWEATNIRAATVTENAPAIHKDLFPQFEFIQEFYLYSAQFFAHTAYALVISFSSVVAFMVVHGGTGRRLFVAVVVYVACGLFFVLGRLQLRSLFFNEEELARRSAWHSISDK